MVECHTGIVEFSKKITTVIILKQSNMPKTVVFCRTLQNCALICGIVKNRMGKNITDPPGALYDGIVDFRLADTFTAVCKESRHTVVCRVAQEASAPHL